MLAPETEATSKRERPGRSLIGAAIVGGVLIPLCAGYAMSLCFNYLIAYALLRQGRNDAQVLEILRSSGLILCSNLLFVVLCVLGGYVAGRWTATQHSATGLTVGLIPALMVMGTAFAPEPPLPLASSTLLSVMVVIGSTAGGAISGKHAA